ncbi:hypothetical protein CRG98_012692, partial [Punica granatum]
EEWRLCNRLKRQSSSLTGRRRAFRRHKTTFRRASPLSSLPSPSPGPILTRTSPPSETRSLSASVSASLLMLLQPRPEERAGSRRILQSRKRGRVWGDEQWRG